MTGVSVLPTVNAALNTTSAVFLGAGYTFIRRKNVAAHRVCMLSAFGASSVFLASYLVYHWQHGATRFAGTGWVRPFYFALLGSHTLLAAVVLPFILAALYRAATGNFAAHRRVARWALPIWFYVSVTGVVVYWMLYHGFRSV